MLVELRNRRQVRSFPKRELVLRKTVRGEDLVVLLVPEEVADLRSGVYRADQVASDVIPQFYRLVGCSAACGDDIGSCGRKLNGSNSGGVLGKN